jgi:hypothetical protein
MFMQVFKKRFLISFLSVMLGFSVLACNDDDQTVKTTVPEISNPEDVYLETDDFSLTYEDLYNTVKTNDGLNQLLMMVDTDLLSSFLAQVSAEDIAEKAKYLKFGTTDDDEIAKFSQEEIDKAEKAYNDSMYLIGFSENPEDYIKVIIARELYARSVLEDTANVDESWFVDYNYVRSQYVNYYYEDINLIKIRFTSEKAANDVLRSFNLVSYNGELRLYTGTAPLPAILTDENTRSLSNDEILNYYLQIYNYVYGDYRDTVDVNSTYDDVLAMDQFTYDYDSLNDASSTLTDFVYETFNTYKNFVDGVSDEAFYTYQPKKYYTGTSYSYYLILNLDRQEKADFTGFDGQETELRALIGDELYDELLAVATDKKIADSSFVNDRIQEFREESGFVLYDYYLALDYKLSNSEYDHENDGHKTNVAVYNDKVITADQLLEYALNLNAPVYAMYAAQTKTLMAAYYETVFCAGEDKCEFNIDKNESDELTSLRAELASAKTEFENGSYSAYYTYDEYIYLAYGAKSQDDLLETYYIKTALQPIYIYDHMVADDYAQLAKLVELMQPYWDNYFSLDVQHLLIYVDRDENGENDDYQEFYDSLEDQAAYDQKLADFEAAIRLYLSDEENTMDALKAEYSAAKLNDATWGEFKKYGFYLIYENLGELTYKDSVGSYEQAFVDELIAMNQIYLQTENENKDYLISDNLTESSYGVHIIKVEKGSDFEQPNFKYTLVLGTDEDNLYPIELVNLNEEFTMDQLKVYVDYRFQEIAGSLDLETIINIYF